MSLKVWPVGILMNCANLPEFAIHIDPIPSVFIVATCKLLGEKRAEMNGAGGTSRSLNICFSCCNTFICDPVSASQIRAVPSSPAVTIDKPSGEKLAIATLPTCPRSVTDGRQGTEC